MSSIQNNTEVSSAEFVISKRRLLQGSEEVDKQKESKVIKNIASDILNTQSSLSEKQEISFTVGLKSPQKIPPSPCKIRPKKNFSAKEQASLYSKLYESAESGKLMIQDKDEFVTPFSRGSYMKVYSIINDETRVVKLYHGNKTSLTNVMSLNSYLQNSIANYLMAIDLKLEIAKIHNIKTAETDGFFVQEKMSYTFNTNHQVYSKEVKNYFMDKEQREKLIASLRPYFLAYFKQNVLFDLSPANIAIRESDKSIVLIDFLEDPEDGFLILRKGISDWAELCAKITRDKTKVQEFLNELTAGFEVLGYDLKINEEIIKSMLLLI